MSDVSSSHEADDDPEEVEIRFIYPDDIIKWHLISPQDTVADLLTAARSLRPDLQIGDVLWRDHSLTSMDKLDEEKLISDLGIDSTAQFIVLRRSSSVSISLWMEDGDSLRQTMKLDQEGSWKDVRSVVQYLFRTTEPMQPTATAFVQEVEYNDSGSVGHGIACFDAMLERFHFNDSEYNYPIASQDWRRIVRRYLRPSSPLPSSNDNSPHVIIDNDTEFLQIVQERCMEPVSPEAMTNPVFVAFFEGVKTQSQFFWKLRSNVFLDPDTQELYSSRWDIPGFAPLRHVIVLMRRFSRPPVIPVPEGFHLEVFVRVGLRLRLEAGRLNATNSFEVFPDVERWHLSYKVDRFTKDFTNCARLSALPEARLFSSAPTTPPRRDSTDSGLSITSFSPGINPAASFECMFESEIV